MRFDTLCLNCRLASAKVTFFLCEDCVKNATRKFLFSVTLWPTNSPSNMLTSVRVAQPPSAVSFRTCHEKRTYTAEGGCATGARN
jgi:hypothetical protein